MLATPPAQSSGWVADRSGRWARYTRRAQEVKPRERLREPCPPFGEVSVAVVPKEDAPTAGGGHGNRNQLATN